MRTRANGKMSREVRRDQIAQATLRIVAARGVKALTTAAIAQEVGISEANLYRHFRNKDEILAETVDMIGEGLRKNVEKVFRAEAPPLKKLKRIFMLHLEYIEKNEGIPRLGFSEEMHIGKKELGEKLSAYIKAYAGGLEAIVEEGKKTGAIRRDIDPKASALMLIGMVQILTFLWSLSGLSFPLAGEAMKLWKNFERCVKAK